MLRHRFIALVFAATLVVQTADAKAQEAPPSNSPRAWEGYWHVRSSYCAGNKYGIPPVGFFPDRIVNWPEAPKKPCIISQIKKLYVGDPFDALFFRCPSAKPGEYALYLRVRVNKLGKLITAWPGGWAFIWERCPTLP